MNSGDRKLAAHMSTFYALAIADALHSMEMSVNGDMEPKAWAHWADLLQSRLASLQKNLATAYPEHFNEGKSDVE